MPQLLTALRARRVTTCLIVLFAGCQAGLPILPAPPPKVGVFTFAGGFKHESLAIAEETLRSLGDRSGAFEAVLFHLHEQPAGSLDLSGLDPESLEPLAGIVFFTTSGPLGRDLLTEAQRRGLLNAVQQGKAFVGIHSATDTFYDWPEYGEMIGAYFDGHPWLADSAPVTIKIEDADHPATAGLPASWVLQEETYQFRDPYNRDQLHVLMSLDTTRTDMTQPGIRRTDGDFALAWTKFYGNGRVFYTALGHRPDVWQDLLFQGHLLGGIRWALGQAAGRPEPP